MTSTAGFPTLFRRHPPIERALARIAQSSIFNGHLFAAGPFVDATGKINSCIAANIFVFISYHVAIYIIAIVITL